MKEECGGEGHPSSQGARQVPRSWTRGRPQDVGLSLPSSLCHRPRGEATGQTPRLSRLPLPLPFPSRIWKNYVEPDVLVSHDLNKKAPEMSENPRGPCPGPPVPRGSSAR